MLRVLVTSHSLQAPRRLHWHKLCHKAPSHLQPSLPCNHRCQSLYSQQLVFSCTLLLHHPRHHLLLALPL